MSKKILLLTLDTFHSPGGLQGMSKTLSHSLHQIAEKNKWNVSLHALNDHDAELIPKYFPSSNFKGFNKNKIKFILRSIWTGTRSDVVILSHVNLSIIGLALRFLNPRCKIWLITHGIEVWRPLTLWKKDIWKTADRIICVSNYTKHKVIELHQVNPKKCIVLNNVPDPFIKFPITFEKPERLLKRYQLKTSDKVIFTLTRIANSEHFKGYEQVMKVVSRIRHRIPNLKYMLTGPCDKNEKIRLQQLAKEYGIEDNFILTGFVNESELADHFLLADVFVLPSKKEGFGIVFLEAMAFGLPIICGNIDGSIDAVRNNKMGTALDPDDLDKLEQAILSKLKDPLSTEDRRNIQRQCLQHFNIAHYKKALEKLIIDESIA